MLVKSKLTALIIVLFVYSVFHSYGKGLWETDWTFSDRQRSRAKDKVQFLPAGLFGDTEPR